jgi:hypothetical protein
MRKQPDKSRKPATKRRRATRRKLAASCAAAGTILVLEAGCADKPTVYILAPRDARAESRHDVVYYIMPPSDLRREQSGREAGKADTAPPPKKDGTIYYIMPPPKKDGAVKKDSPIFYIMPPPKKDGQ